MSKSDTSLYIKKESNNPVVIILYVDDLVIGGKNIPDVNKVKLLLSGKFEMKDMHELHYFLGIEVISVRIVTGHNRLTRVYMCGCKDRDKYAQAEILRTKHGEKRVHKILTWRTQNGKKPRGSTNPKQ